MKKISGNLRLALCSTIILSAICVILLTVSLFVSYDELINYFNKSFIYSITKALLVITVILSAVAAFMLPKNELSGDSPTTLPVSIVSALPALALLTMSVLVFSGILETGSSSKIIAIICAVLSAISAIYFVFNCIFADNNNSVKVFLGIALPLANILMIAASYFDMSVSINAPIKTYLYVALISFSLWSLLELRTMTEKKHPRLYFGLGLISTVLTASASIPWLISAFTKNITAPIYPSYIIYNVIVFAEFVYVLTRMIVFVNARGLIERLSVQTYSDDEPQAEENKESKEEE